MAFVANIPDFTAIVNWPEHPVGAVQFRTNNRGFREDEPTELASDAFRVLVLGDSHTEGAVNNDESFANVLERQIRRRSDMPVEVLNAGVSGTGPYEMEGMLKKQLELGPDLVIAALFTGNDFTNGLMISDFYSKRRQRDRSREYTERLLDARDTWPVVIAQGFNQAYLFEFDPDSARVALDATVDRYAAMAELCADQDIGFLVVVIPTKADVDGDDDAETLEGLLEALDLSRHQYGITERMSHRFVDAMEERGIRCIDMTPPDEADRRALLLAPRPPPERGRPCPRRAHAAGPGGRARQGGGRRGGRLAGQPGLGDEGGPEGQRAAQAAFDAAGSGHQPVHQP